MRNQLSLITLSLSLFTAACGGGAAAGKGPETPAQTAPAAISAPSTGGGTASVDPVIKEIWSSKCGSCHAKVEPNSKPRARIEAMMKVHKSQKRVTMTDDQWAQMTEFLAPAGGATPTGG